ENGRELSGEDRQVGVRQVEPGQPGHLADLVNIHRTRPQSSVPSPKSPSTGDWKLKTLDSHLRGGHWLALERPLHLAGPDALDAHAGPDRLAIPDDAYRLEVRVEGPAAGSGDLFANPAQVLGLPAVGLLVAEDRLFAADVALHAHGRVAPTN